MSDSFDTHAAGTPDAAWRALLANAPVLHWLDEPILIVSPHPDDETLGAGGVQRRYHGARVVVVTGGEGSHPGWPNLRAIRRGELALARRQLASRGDPPSYLGLPDGHVDVREPQLERLLGFHLRGVATLIAPYERDGHPDHDAVGRVCRRLARRNRTRLLQYMIWGWHQSDVSAFRPPHFVRLALGQREQQAKRRAIACFRSQLEGGAGAIVPPHVLPYFDRPYEAFLQ
jgi:LmbE family N-acetylglucosaminyl deacetylase